LYHPVQHNLPAIQSPYVGGVTMITKGNANLDPETSLTYDFGAGYDLAKWGLPLTLPISYRCG